VNVAELMPRAFCVFGGWNCPSKTDSRTASVPISKSGARHHSANGSPMRNPVAAMRLTIVRYGSWSCASRFAKSAPAMMAGAFFRRRCGRCADIEAARVHLPARLWGRSQRSPCDWTPRYPFMAYCPKEKHA